ncbi:RDD family protein [bacterium]|nr:RDD family protein [bacterium]
MSDSGADTNLPKLKPVRPRPAFSGFFGRVGAFILDVLVLYMLGWALNRGFRPALLHLNPALPWLSYIFAYVYFLIGEGPLGRGRTTGKYVLSMHIVTADGGVPSWPQAARRALLKLAFFFALSDPFSDLLIFPASAYFQADTAVKVLGIVCTSLTITIGLSITIHPWKRGIHDLLAGTFVTGDPTPSGFHDMLAEEPDLLSSRRMALNFKMVGIFFVLATVVMLYRPIHDQLQPKVRERFDTISRLQADVSVPGLRIVQAAYPDPAYSRLFLENVNRVRAQAAQRNDAVPTTDSLRAMQFYDGESIAVHAVKVSDSLTTATAMSPAMIKAAEQLRAKAWQIWKEREAKSPSGLPARQFKLLLVEPFRFLVYNGTEWKAVIEGPADPAAGPLTARDLNKPVPNEPGPKPNATPTPAGA